MQNEQADIVELRRLNMEDIDTPLLERPVVFRGTVAAAKDYAALTGYRWKSTKELFGGHFADAEGNCLLPT